MNSDLDGNCRMCYSKNLVKAIQIWFTTTKNLVEMKKSLTNCTSMHLLDWSNQICIASTKLFSVCSCVELKLLS